ncbi:MAG: DNA repair protein RecO [Thermoanaerobaculia bacterium]|nr:DNA repair protein RecO [Thermoanaerobaculia bacterium]
MATVLTRERGLLRAVVHGARGRSKRAASLQLLTEVEISVFRREGSDLGSVREIEPRQSAFSLAMRPDTALLLPYMAESALAFCPPEMAVQETYRLIRHVLDALIEGQAPGPLAGRYFECWILKLAGIFPSVRTCSVCGNALSGKAAFEPSGPFLLHPDCGERGRPLVTEGTVALLQSITASPLPAVRLPQAQEREALLGAEMIAREVRRHFLGFELKSYALLGVLDATPRSPC